MEKVKLVFNPSEDDEELVIKKIVGAKLAIRPYLTYDEQVQLINEYLKNYFFPEHPISVYSSYDLLGAEFTLMLTIIDLTTSIKVVDDEGNLAVSMSDIMAHDIGEVVYAAVRNYATFRALLDKMVADIKEQKSLEKSIGFVIDNLANKVLDLVEKFSTTEISQENLQKLVEATKEITANVKQSPIADVIADKKRKGRPKKSV